ncbi:MAG: hypothetical protein FJ290_03795 [Planctomycetes bacterium]|nr:hypothetical protein [Planctomycetota bacterium]
MGCTRWVKLMWAMALLAACWGAGASAGQADFAREWDASRFVRPAPTPGPASIARDFGRGAFADTSRWATRALDVDNLVRKDITRDFAADADRCRDMARRAAEDAERTLARFSAQADRDRLAAMRAADDSARDSLRATIQDARDRAAAMRASDDAARDSLRATIQAHRDMMRAARDQARFEPIVVPPMPPIPEPRFDVGGMGMHGSWKSW